MAWTSPRSWVTGEVLTAALLNAQLRDNLLATGFTAVGVVTAPAAGSVGLTVAGASGQTANLQEWKATTGGAALVSIQPAGTLTTPFLVVAGNTSLDLIQLENRGGASATNGTIYNNGGQLYWRGGLGTITLIAPS